MTRVSYKHTVLLVCMLLSMSGALPSESFSMTQTALTPEGAAYQMSASGTRMTVRNDKSGENNREIFWNEHAPESTAATHCATWVSGIDVAQQGFAFRVARQSGGYNAIVFARNIWLRQYWIFAPKLFHTGSDYAYERVSTPDVAYLPKWDSPRGIDLSEYLGRDAAPTYPLRVCVSLNARNVLRFAVAKGSDPMPPLDQPGRQGGSWQLDIAGSYHAGEGLTGRSGIFVGHIPAGTSLVIEDLSFRP